MLLSISLNKGENFMNGIKWAVKNAFDFKGRATKKEFWSFAKYDIAFISLIFLLETFALNKKDMFIYQKYYFPNITIFIFLITSIPRLAAVSRRTHDVGSSSPVLILHILMAPLFSIQVYESPTLLNMAIILIPFILPILVFNELSDGDNKYGPAPIGVPIKVREIKKEEPPKVERTTASQDYNKLFANKNGQIDQLLKKMNKKASDDSQFCHICNAPLRPLEKFCSSCGNPIK